MNHAATYLHHKAQPYGANYEACVARFQVGFVADRVCRTSDAAFKRAVETCERLISAIKANAGV